MVSVADVRRKECVRKFSLWRLKNMSTKFNGWRHFGYVICGKPLLVGSLASSGNRTARFLRRFMVSGHEKLMN